MVTPVVPQSLELSGVQIRYISGHTRQHPPQDLRRALRKIIRGTAIKLVLEFTDVDGNIVCLTLRNDLTLENPVWMLYGYRLPKNGELSNIEGIPTFEETFRTELRSS